MYKVRSRMMHSSSDLRILPASKVNTVLVKKNINMKIKSRGLDVEYWSNHSNTYIPIDITAL